MALVGVAFIFYSIVTTGVYKQMRLENIEKSLDFETEKVNKIIAELERGAVFYTIGGLLYYEGLTQESGQKYAEEGLRGLPNAVGGGFWFEPYSYKSNQLRAGLYVFKNAQTGEVIFNPSFDINNIDYLSMDWYHEMISSIKEPYQVVWLSPYKDSNPASSLMTTAGAGIFSNGKLIGVTTVDWEINEVIKQLIEIKPTENSLVLLCIPKKDYVIASDHENSFVGDSIKNIPWDINADFFKYNGINYMQFGRYMMNGWLITVQIPEEEIFADIERQNRIFLVIIELAIVAMLCFEYMLISKFINMPLKKLINDVAQVALGNLDMQININSKDELGQLAKTFNRMTGELKKSIEENAYDREEKKRISTELTIARDIQTNMLPSVFPAFPGRNEFDIYATMIPAREVGGDLYDFFLLDKDNLVIGIGDVSGKGIPASLFMVNAKTLISNSASAKSPKVTLEFVNNKLCENNEACIFVTVFMGIYNIPTGRLTFVNAGHNPPLIKKKNGSFEYVRTKPNFVLAIFKDAEFTEEEMLLEEGDTIYLYTDGVTEAMNQDKKLFGEERLLDTLNKCASSSPKDILSAVKHGVENFADGAEQADDITMLALTINRDQRLDDNKLTIEANLENLEKVLSFINAELEKCKYPDILVNQIDLAVEEIFSNISRYAYGDGVGDVTIFISARERAVIRFEDSGKPFNPLEQDAPNLQKDIIDRDVGGLGIVLVKKTMDSVKYSRLDNKNVLTIIKYYLN
ncbi:MAG: SpoIIE family protein phosphatase [Treponema sp.]|jgi:sigma-B regulation protein RsbU (phosphoserine phosphatase)|nr:SpoIIE family protein phosphatase [Treponema sp.]